MGSINVVLLDLDGVIRHFDADHLAAVEQHNNLPPGTLQAAAFEPVLAEQVVTGKMSFDDWVHRVGEIVGSQRAAEAWLHEVGRIDWDLVSIVDDLRAAGTTVAVLTNGTDTVQRELDELGVTSHFDAIYNSAFIGYAKPDRRCFEHVCGELGVAPEQVFFTDDTEKKLSGAIELGMTARLFQGLETFAAHLDEFVR